MRCLLTGHDGRLELREGRMYLRCARCQRISEGLTVEPRYRVTQPGLADRHRLYPKRWRVVKGGRA